jgi:multiple inositol-polyphosphate phosphatase / 2,3-bisphosphoglycerate 3-phosphatase
MKFFSVIYLFTSLLSASVYGQDCAPSFLGSKTLYKATAHNTAAPAGYKPVFINHVGRHGARHLTSAVNTSFIYDLLLKADSANALTADGKSLAEKIRRLDKIENKNVKSISDEGKKEQVDIADRMFANYATVFLQATLVFSIDYTKEVRTLQTSEAFLQELKTKIADPQVTKQVNDTTLRFYDLSPAYLEFKKNGSWINLIGQLKASLHYAELADTIAGRFFIPSYLTTLTNQDRDNFTSGLFGFITILYSIQKEIAGAGFTGAEADMQTFLRCDQLATLAAVDNAEDFLQKGPGTNADGIQVIIAMPLLADFIQTTDNYIQTRLNNAHFRFCHAETIAPFAALLGLHAASQSTINMRSLENIWDAGKVIPLSANIQWILYQKKGSENFLIKFLLNENEVAVTGLATKSFPYYNWKDVRNFYMQKMKRFSQYPNQNWINYLKEIK